MSWDEYVNRLMQSDSIAEAALGNSESVWATSPNFAITVKEIAAFAGGSDGMFKNGVYLGGKKYFLLRYNLEDDKEPYLNLKSAKGEDGKTCNATVFKTKTGYVIGVGGENSHGGAVTILVCKMGTYLMELNY